MHLVDVHTHLTHEKFDEDLTQVILRAKSSGLKAIVVNGLNPKSNRQIIEMAKSHPIIKPALGIYPVDAVNDKVRDLPFEVAQFDVDKEVKFIKKMAEEKKIFALGECGLDAYWLGEETFARQESVFLRFIELSLEFDLPLIIHTRKREKRAMEMLAFHKVKKVNFHCFGGKTKQAINWADTYGWYFSIPANSHRNQAFTKLLGTLRPDRILTETDAPYLPPVPGTRNEPQNVKNTVTHFAQIREWSFEKAEDQVWTNFKRLFNNFSDKPN